MRLSPRHAIRANLSSFSLLVGFWEKATVKLNEMIRMAMLTARILSLLLFILILAG